MPPSGYQMPCSVCMWAMPHSTAGLESGHDPTYWVKWSIICATRGSGTYFRTVLATLLPIRIFITSPRIFGLNPARTSIMSRIPPMLFQKK